VVYEMKRRRRNLDEKKSFVVLLNSIEVDWKVRLR